MEKKTTVGPKGQIVIPKDIRDKIGIKEYSDLFFFVLRNSDTSSGRVTLSL